MSFTNPVPAKPSSRPAENSRRSDSDPPWNFVKSSVLISMFEAVGVETLRMANYEEEVAAVTILYCEPYIYVWADVNRVSLKGPRLFCRGDQVNQH